MKLGLLSACMPDRSLDDVAAWAGSHGFDTLELAAWPRLGDRPFVACHIAGDGLTGPRWQGRRKRSSATGWASRRSRSTTTTCIRIPARGRRSTTTCVACVDVAEALGGVPVGTFIGRDVSKSVAENLREAEHVFPPLVDTPASAACG